MNTSETPVNLLAELESILAAKTAKAKTAAAPGVAGMPGSEHDGPATVRPADPEIMQMVPPGSRTNAGAGDNSDLTRKQLKDATQPAGPSPSTHPAISSDLGKTAELGNAILAEGAKIAAAAKAASEMPVDRTSDQPGSAVTDPKLKDGAQPAAADPKTKPAISGEIAKEAASTPCAGCKTPDACKAAGACKGDDKSAERKLELTPDIYQKIGMLVCSCDEGMDLALQIMEKQAGAQAAAGLLGELQAHEQKLAAAGDPMDEYMEKFAGAEPDAFKLGQAMAEEAMQGALTEGDIPAPPPAELENMGAIDQLGAEGSITPEVAQALVQLLESGQLDEILGEVGGDAGGAAGGGDPAAAMTAPALDPTAAAGGSPSQADAASGEASDVGKSEGAPAKAEEKPKEEKPKEDEPENKGAAKA